jgi:hypothetical protein
MSDSVSAVQALLFDLERRYVQHHQITVREEADDGSRWAAKIMGEEESTDGMTLRMALSGITQAALRECLEAEQESGDGVANLNFLLTSLANGPSGSGMGRESSCPLLPLDRNELELLWDVHESNWTVEWFFDDMRILQDGEEVLSEVDVAEDPPELIPEELWDAIDELWELEGGDLLNDSWADGTHTHGFDVLRARGARLLPSSEADSRNAPSLGGRSHSPMEALDLVLKGSHSRLEHGPTQWPVLVELVLPDVSVDRSEKALPEEERIRRLDAAASFIRKSVADALQQLRGHEVFVLSQGRPSPAMFASGWDLSGLGASRVKLKWWDPEAFVSKFLDSGSQACRDSVAPNFGYGKDRIILGVRTDLPFVGSHRGRRLSQGRTLSVIEAGMNAFRMAKYSDGQPAKGALSSFLRGEVSGDDPVLSDLKPGRWGRILKSLVPVPDQPK